MSNARPFADVNTKTLADGVRYYRDLASPSSSFAKEAAATQQARLDELALRACKGDVRVPCLVTP
jgi:hypothetical protein